MRILVTGGAGFVGSHIADLLLADENDVLVVDDFSSGVHWCPAGAELLKLDLASLRSEHWGAAGLGAVVHAAAYPELRHNWDSAEERDRLRRSNIDGIMALLEAMPRGVPIVYLSTASVYGSDSERRSTCTGTPGAHESDATPENIESPYAATKFAGEALVAAYAYARGIPWHVLRLVNVVGARTHRGVIADFVRMMREKGAIHAADDGRQTKPWVHVADVADAVARCLRQDVPSGVYNVTSKELVSWWDIVDAMGVGRASVTFEERDRGAVGDPHNLRVSGAKLAPYFVPRRAISDGIKDAFDSLGWKT